jgi:protein-S-isoprenylcysteine O-methyltransferase Ste14
MFFDEEIGTGWCLGLAWRCTPAEAIGFWSVVLFFSTVVLVTLVHLVILQGQNRSATRDEATLLRQTTTATTTTVCLEENAGDDDLRMLCSLVIYFFTFTFGCLLWVTKPHWVHPIQIWEIQLFGSAMLLVCAILYIIIHIDLGENWSPIPEEKEGHQLVTHGVYRYARHPMYSVFLWAVIGTLLATLNWVIAWCVSGSVMIMLQRIKKEERILVGLFGTRYLEYRRHVSALGPPWRCLGYDGELRMTTTTGYRREL